MTFHFSMKKVLDVKEHEKASAENALSASIRTFEEIATMLYDLLKKKEDLIAKSEKDLITGMSVHYIQQREKNIAYLEQQIAHLQTKTQKARRDMTDKERLLLTKSVDVKKYSRMKEIQKDKYLLKEKAAEAQFLDEISVQQYVRR